MDCKCGETMVEVGRIPTLIIEDAGARLRQSEVILYQCAKCCTVSVV